MDAIAQSPVGTNGIGVVLASVEDPIDDLFLAVSNLLQKEGYRVRGFIQSQRQLNPGTEPATFMQTVSGSRTRQVSQDLGAGSHACKVDAGVIAELAGQLVNELEQETDLLVINRFGRCESLGGGLRLVIETAFVQDIPVLTAVRPRYRFQWEEFSCGMANTLNPDADEILDWCLSLIDPQRASFHAGVALHVQTGTGRVAYD